jgi:hypothetical protein
LGSGGAIGAMARLKTPSGSRQIEGGSAGAEAAGVLSFSSAVRLPRTDQFADRLHVLVLGGGLQGAEGEPGSGGEGGGEDDDRQDDEVPQSLLNGHRRPRAKKVNRLA